jgi:hypothetical protein
MVLPGFANYVLVAQVSGIRARCQDEQHLAIQPKDLIPETWFLRSG